MASSGWGRVTRAGHLRYFCVFSPMKKDFFAFSIKLTGGRLFKWDWRRNRLPGIGQQQPGIGFDLKKKPKYRKCPPLGKTIIIYLESVRKNIVGEKNSAKNHE